MTGGSTPPSPSSRATPDSAYIAALWEYPTLMQYWDDYAHLHARARVAPHTQWWKWLMDHRGKSVGLYHEVHTLRGAEAIDETRTQPVGPATFCRLEAVRSGEGRSRQRLDQFRGTGE